MDLLLHDGIIRIQDISVVRGVLADKAEETIRLLKDEFIIVDNTSLTREPNGIPEIES
jgi:hypothetical protein